MADKKPSTASSREKMLENDAFLSQLARNMPKIKLGGTFYLNMKRWSKRESVPPAVVDDIESLRRSIQPVADESTYPVIVRAVIKKLKISTLVQPQDLEKFQTSYSNIIRLNTDALKKKDRKARKKNKKPASQSKPAASGASTPASK